MHERSPVCSALFLRVGTLPLGLTTVRELPPLMLETFVPFGGTPREDLGSTVKIPGGVGSTDIRGRPNNEWNYFF